MNLLKPYLHRNILSAFVLGFSCGLPLLLTGPTHAAWLTEDGISLRVIGLFIAIGTPYTLKFLWAPVFDKVKIPVLTRLLGRRRGWMLVTQIVLLAATLGLSVTKPSESLAIVASMAVFLAFCSASQDAVVDAWRVEILEPAQLGPGSVASVFGYRLGMLAAGPGALYLASTLAWSHVYFIMAGLAGIGILTTLASAEPVPRPPSAAEVESAVGDVLTSLEATPKTLTGWLDRVVIGPFRELGQIRNAVLVTIFTILYKFGDSLAAALVNPFYLELGYSKADIADVGKTYGFAAALIGLFLGGWILKSLGIWKSLWICGILQLLSNLSHVALIPIGTNLPLLAFCVGGENLSQGMGTAAIIAYLSSLCNSRNTATQFGVLSSFTAVGRTWLSSFGGFLAEGLGWRGFFIATTVLAIPGLCLLFWLNRIASSVSKRNDHPPTWNNPALEGAT